MKLAMVAALAAGLAACGSPTVDTKDAPQVFAKMCVSCHGESGKPTPSMVARLGVRDLTDPDFRARVTPEIVEKQLRGGSKSKLMPSFVGVLTDEQITGLAAYVASPKFLEQK